MAKHKHILVVDDEEALRRALTTELTSKGYTVDTAADGDEAIAYLPLKTFDLILLDIKMERVQGLDVLKYVKANYPAVKVIMLTGYADLKNAIESKKFGADDFVPKPYDLFELALSIENVLAGKSM